MVNGDLATEFDPSTGRMLGAAVNRERAAISQHLGIGPNRAICRSACTEIQPEAPGAASPGPGLCGQGGFITTPHTRATMEALRGSPVFRRICGFVRRSDIPSEATFLGPSRNLPISGWGRRSTTGLGGTVGDPGIGGHISPDATAIEGREKPTAKPKPPQNRRPGKRAAPGGGKCGNLSRKPGFSARWGNPPRRPWRSCRCTACGDQKELQRL